MSASFGDRIDLYVSRVDLALDKALPAASEKPERLHEAMRYAIFNGGKRVRAVLVYAAGEAVGEAAEAVGEAAEEAMAEGEEAVEGMMEEGEEMMEEGEAAVEEMAEEAGLDLVAGDERVAVASRRS